MDFGEETACAWVAICGSSYRISRIYKYEKWANAFEKWDAVFCEIAIIEAGKLWMKHAFQFCAQDDTIMLGKCTAVRPKKVKE